MILIDRRLTYTAFQSTLSMRRATWEVSVGDDIVQFQSTLSMRRATNGGLSTTTLPPISIHALHEESDLICAYI